MSDAEEDDNGSLPPDPNPQILDAAAHTTHPLWQRAAGRGRGAAPAPAAGDGPRFSGISFADLEMRGRANGDGGDSSLFSDADEDEERDRTAKKQKRDKGKASADKKAQAGLAAAVFGSAGIDDDELPSDDESDVRSFTSSAAVREAKRAAFPVKGVNCVACSMPGRFSLIDDFVQNNCSRMLEDALFKHAALVYKVKIQEPAEEEGVVAPSVTWKDLRAHYTLHVCNPKMARMESVRTLSGMRKTLELELMREEEDGSRKLDRGNSEMLLKVLTLQSKELQLLQEGGHPRPAGRGKRAED